MSNEIDLYPAVHPELADLIDGAIGALSMFHDTYGYYADGVGPQTARMRIESLAPSGVETGPLLVWARRRAAEAA